MHGRHNFDLQVPRPQTTGLTELVRNAASVDPDRLEAILAGLRDETLMATGLNALASVSPAVDTLRITGPAGARARAPDTGIPPRRAA